MKKSSLKKLLAGISALCFATAAVPFVGSADETGKPTLVGDANFDGQVDLSDAVIIMQALANPDKYGLGGSDEHAITQQGWINADCNGAANILRKAFTHAWDACKDFQFLSTPASVGFKSLNPSSVPNRQKQRAANKKK